MNTDMQQLSLLEQSRVDDPGAPDAVHVRRIARDITSELGLTAPVDFRVVSSYQGIGAVQVTDIPWAGCLISEGGRLVIKLREVDGRQRQRFTWAHELAHTFFPGFRYKPQFRCDPVVAPSREGTDLEALCDVAAAELLMPASGFSQDLADRELTTRSLEELSELYDASLEATAHRMIDLADRPAVMIVFEEMHKPADRGNPAAEPRLRVSYAFAKGAWPFIPKWKSVEPSGPLGRALEGEVIDDKSSLLELTGDHREVDVSAKLYPYYDRQGRMQRRVIALCQ